MNINSPSETTASFTTQRHIALASLLPRDLRQLRVNEEGIAGENRFAKLHPVGAHEITDPARALADAHHQHARHLRHRLDLQHARHHRVTGKMALENGSLIVTDLIPRHFVSPSKERMRSTIRNG